MSSTDHVGGVLLSAFLLSLLVTFLAKKWGFFRLPEQSKRELKRLSFYHLLGAFTTYFATAYLLLPILALLGAFLYTGEFTTLKAIPRELTGIINVMSILVIFLAVTFYTLRINKESKEVIFGSARSFPKILKCFGFGALALLICYPVVIFVDLSAEQMTKWIWGAEAVKQVAVQQLQQLLSQRLIFLLMGFGVVFVIPFVEELLFRGFLQSWLRRYCNRGWSIALTSVLFSLVHYASSQGVGNVELMSSLFVLSCYLGYLYERERALWAPVGLHAVFNLCSVLTIFWNGTV